MACPYKDALGVPGEGFHSLRFMDVAVGDTVGTFLLAGLVSRALGFDYWPTLIGLLILGEIMHWYFCVDTTVIKFLKGRTSGESP